MKIQITLEIDPIGADDPAIATQGSEHNRLLSLAIAKLMRTPISELYDGHDWKHDSSIQVAAIED